VLLALEQEADFAAITIDVEGDRPDHVDVGFAPVRPTGLPDAAQRWRWEHRPGEGDARLVQCTLGREPTEVTLQHGEWLVSASAEVWSARTPGASVRRYWIAGAR